MPRILPDRPQRTRTRSACRERQGPGPCCLEGCPEEGPEEDQKGRQARRPGRWKRVLGWIVVAGLAMILALMGIFYFTYKKTQIPDPNSAFEAQSTYVYYSGGHSRIGQFADQNRESIPLADIPQSMQNAAIAAEDRTFYTNSGIDPKGILRAAFSNAKGNATQGASTITQQYVKILYLSQERTLSRKIKEAFLSLKVQQEKSKDAILEGYLNTIYFGRGAYGVQAAADAYFDKPAKKLTVPGVGDARGGAELAELPLARPRRRRPPGSPGALRLRAARHGLDGPARLHRGRPLLRQAPRRRQAAQPQPVRRPTRLHALDGQGRSCAPRASTTPRSTPAACGWRPRSPARRCAPPRTACSPSVRRASSGCTSPRRASTSRPVPCSASTAGRTTSTAS